MTTKAQEFLAGKKTYIVAAGVIVAAAVGFLLGELTLGEAIVSALTGLGLGTLRLGVKKAE